MCSSYCYSRLLASVFGIVGALYSSSNALGQHSCWDLYMKSPIIGTVIEQ
jgi:hypothetical protein